MIKYNICLLTGDESEFRLGCSLCRVSRQLQLETSNGNWQNKIRLFRTGGGTARTARGAEKRKCGDAQMWSANVRSAKWDAPKSLSVQVRSYRIGMAWQLPPHLQFQPCPPNWPRPEKIQWKFILS